ncbi:MAG: HD domain-containing protein [Clostridium sp.]|nr:HD domain-containing protein [uncultured Clostridium sp.]
MKKELLEKITDHLLTDIKPSTYVKSIEDDLWGTPLQIINELKTVEQSPKYHPEGNVYNHVMLVVDKAAQIRSLANSKKEFMLASLLHDVGKKVATKKNIKGKYTSYNHDKIGEKIVNDILVQYDINNIEREKIVNLVKYHMHHLYILKSLPYENTEEMIKDVELNDMILLFISDRLGRGQKRKDDIEKELSDVKTIIGILNKKYNVDIDVFEKAYKLIIK